MGEAHLHLPGMSAFGRHKGIGCGMGVIEQTW